MSWDLEIGESSHVNKSMIAQPYNDVQTPDYFA